VHPPAHDDWLATKRDSWHHSCEVEYVDCHIARGGEGPCVPHMCRSMARNSSERRPSNECSRLPERQAQPPRRGDM